MTANLTRSKSHKDTLFPHGFWFAEADPSDEIRLGGFAADLSEACAHLASVISAVSCDLDEAFPKLRLVEFVAGSRNDQFAGKAGFIKRCQIAGDRFVIIASPTSQARKI